MILILQTIFILSILHSFITQITQHMRHVAINGHVEILTSQAPII